MDEGPALLTACFMIVYYWNLMMEIRAGIA
jgi:hypothetical protein